MGEQGWRTGESTRLLTSLLTGFIVVIDGNRGGLGVLHHSGLVNLERERHLFDLVKVQNHVLAFDLVTLKPKSRFVQKLEKKKTKNDLETQRIITLLSTCVQ